MDQYERSARILRNNRKFIPGGVVSVNRATQPAIVFVKGRGAYMWDADGNRYVDYHAAFALHFLCHNDKYVTDAVMIEGRIPFRWPRKLGLIRSRGE
jgi:glutamate-1-semialdehyde 2,1-aminomutase